MLRIVPVYALLMLEDDIVGSAAYADFEGAMVEPFQFRRHLAFATSVHQALSSPRRWRSRLVLVVA